MAQGGKIKPHVLRLQDDHVIGRPGHGQDVIEVAVRYGTATKHRLAAFEQVNHFIQTYFRHGTDLLCRPSGTSPHTAARGRWCHRSAEPCAAGPSAPAANLPPPAAPRQEDQSDRSYNTRPRAMISLMKASSLSTACVTSSGVFTRRSSRKGRGRSRRDTRR